MSQFACPACRRVLKSKPELAGKQVKCTCGQQFRVPSVGGSAGAGSGAIRNVAATNGKLTQSFGCGKRLAAPLSARGKSVRCPCGQVNKVPLGDAHAGSVAVAAPVVATSPAPTSPAPTSLAAAASNDWLDDLPVHPAAAFSSASGMAMQAHANPYASPAAVHPGSYASQTPASATANSHLAEAQRQIAKDRRNGSSGDRGGSSFFSGGTMGGLLMMIIALVWFFGGLAAGVIFFYPPVLFVLGFIALIKAAMGDD
ncbi:hypothetical protein [Novipirellula caenicola]|uniref:Uncharacterized protein n=1 Tax=Novipirellula caenicola TaxID=1536901 RepID=A0ABP9VLK2_9BACT